MKTKMFMLIAATAFLAAAGCGSEQPKDSSNTETPKAQEAGEKPDDGKGVGEIKQVTLTDPLDAGMVKMGKSIYEMKCAACHKLDAERVVGPGWQGITNRRRPEWIMNMITNVDMMLDKDPQAQALLEECLTRMPNQNVAVGDARNILEYMRQNDLETAGSKDEAVNN